LGLIGRVGLIGGFHIAEVGLIHTLRRKMRMSSLRLEMASSTTSMCLGLQTVLSEPFLIEAAEEAVVEEAEEVVEVGIVGILCIEVGIEAVAVVAVEVGESERERGERG
jgi:hypothetical protein